MMRMDTFDLLFALLILAMVVALAGVCRADEYAYSHLTIGTATPCDGGLVHLSSRGIDRWYRNMAAQAQSQRAKARFSRRAIELRRMVGSR